jgi:hypothetical protein
MEFLEGLDAPTAPHQASAAQVRAMPAQRPILRAAGRDAATEMDRWTLLTMQQSWLALADNEEWLEGRRISRSPAGGDLSA